MMQFFISESHAAYRRVHKHIYSTRYRYRKQFIQTNNYNTCCQVICKYGGVIVKLYVTKFDLFVHMLKASIFQDYIMSLYY